MTEDERLQLPSRERESLEQGLQFLWQRRECGITERAALEAAAPVPLAALIEQGLAREEGGRLALTERGEALGADITRRHRLAERLLVDVLSLEQSAVDLNACVFEHILSPEVAGSICTLLGHPSECPHGLPIPAGECCREGGRRLGALVTPLSEWPPGARGRVAYLRLRDHPELHRLLSLGVIPGAALHLHQTFPAFVITVGETQLALEQELAARIFVRRTSP